GPTLSETVEFEKQEEVELSAEDAPVIEDRFELPDANPLDEVAEPVHTGQGQLIQSTDEEDDVDFTGSVGPSPDTIPELPDSEEEIPLPPNSMTLPEIPEVIEDATPSIPAIPEETAEEVPELPDIEETPTPVVPDKEGVPELPEDAEINSSSEQP
ncbi:MAG TPA: hypothetical protein D7I00_01970, partial [Candidatus Poseidoniales archaeon]